MTGQWKIVAGVVAVACAGAFALVKLSPQMFPVEVGSKAPAFTAVDVATGDRVTLDRFRGQVVVLNVWATYCEPCRTEMPALERLQRALSPRGLEIVAVSVDMDGPSVVREFGRDYGLTFRILQDRSRAIERAYQTTGVPETFVLNRHGVIVKKVVGPYEWDSQASEALMERLLDAGS